MTVKEVTIPDDVTLRFHRNGELWFEAEAIELDLLMADAQSGLDVTDASTRSLWLERFRSLLQDKLDCEVSIQQAYGILGATQDAMQELKKTLPGLQPLPSSTESTPTS